jgi:tRNA pseudouridine38-40 synthase
VSCNRGAFQLFCESPLEIVPVLEKMNKILPDDIRLTDAEPVPADFNIIHGLAYKEYSYNFCFGDKYHPFAASNMVFFSDQLAIGAMKEAAAEFIGVHDFRRYCSQDKITDDYIREIIFTELVPHPLSGLEPVPVESYRFKVAGNGFLRYQIRIMMAALVEVGRGNLSVQKLKDSLLADEKSPIYPPAPAHGLILENIVFKK